MDNEKPKLKPCPFCGGEAITEGDNKYSLAVYFMTCRSCGAEGPWHKTESGAISAWNNRPADAVKEQLAKALESTQERLSLLLDPFMGSPRFLLPEGSVARGVVEGAFYGVGKKIEDALAAYREEQKK